MREYWDGKYINKLKDNEIFVFGSNPEGRHGAGAAKIARNKFGAIYGFSRGLTGQSYALITKNLTAGFKEIGTGITYHKEGEHSVSPEQIMDNIRELYQCAREHPDKRFLISYQYEINPDGTPKVSLNGYSSREMMQFFTECDTIPDNIIFNRSYEAQMTYNPSDYTFFFHLSSPFSNFHPSIFRVKDETFISNEQFMMYCKAKLFKDEKVAEEILGLNESNDVAKAFIKGELTGETISKDTELSKAWNNLMKDIKKCGRKVSNYVDLTWSKRRKSYVKYGAREKFNQNYGLKEMLMETGHTKMVEASKYDSIWGIGLSASDARKTPPKDWPGLNLLGDIMNELKEEFRPEYNAQSSLKL